MAEPKTKTMHARKCKMLVVDKDEHDNYVGRSHTCEQPAVFTEENGWACPFHQQQIAKLRQCVHIPVNGRCTTCNHKPTRAEIAANPAWLTESQIKESQVTKQHKELLAAIIAVGQEFKPLHKKLTTLFTPEVRQQIETLKTEVFGVSAGLRGNLVAVGEDTHPTSGPKTSLTFYWDEFVSWCFGVSARRINQLLDTDEVRAERAEAKRLEDERVAAEEVKVYTEAAEAIYAANPHPKTDKEAAAALRVGWEKLKAVGGHDLNRVKMIDFCLNEIENPITPLGEGDELTQSIEAVGDNPHYERKDPYAYFEQFKAEPQTMGDEISAMLIEFGLDQHQIKEVLRYVEMSAKRTLNQMQTAVAA